ncbi:hypothetical protein EDD16DRAFT_1523102 [Pisolithus croceorrhizus]|nr:hypothetical protein EDD16DRAFT_1523102 [Pisolithus croceorrhizus]
MGHIETLPDYRCYLHVAYGICIFLPDAFPNDVSLVASESKDLTADSRTTIWDQVICPIACQLPPQTSMRSRRRGHSTAQAAVQVGVGNSHRLGDEPLCRAAAACWRPSPPLTAFQSSNAHDTTVAYVEELNNLTTGVPSSRVEYPCRPMFYDKVGQSESVADIEQYHADPRWFSSSRIRLERVGALSECDDIALAILAFWRYIQVMRIFQTGSNQPDLLVYGALIPTISCHSSSDPLNYEYLRPKAIHDNEVIGKLADEYEASVAARSQPEKSRLRTGKSPSPAPNVSPTNGSAKYKSQGHSQAHSERIASDAEESGHDSKTWKPGAVSSSSVASVAIASAQGYPQPLATVQNEDAQGPIGQEECDPV